MICKSCKKEMYAERQPQDGSYFVEETGKYWCIKKSCKRLGLVFAEVEE